jgi:hypothetical protein
MKKTLLPLLAFIFLATQMLTFQHMGEYDFVEHTHKGTNCEVSVYFTQSKSFDSAVPIPALPLPAAIASVEKIISAKAQVLVFFAYKWPSHAPPRFLQA